MKEPSSDVKQKLKSLKGPDRAAIFMLALPEEVSAYIFSKLDAFDIRQLSIAMISLGKVASDVVEGVLWEFATQISTTGSLIGTIEGTERLLTKILPKEQVEMLMEEIRGPAGRTLWDKLGNVNEDVLSKYLKNEYPQTIAVVLSRIKSENAAKVISAFPESLALEVIVRMLNMEAVRKEVIDDIEGTLRTEFMSNLARTAKRDPYALIADIFNFMDRSSEDRIMEKLSSSHKDTADKIKSLMFKFEELIGVDQASLQVIIRSVDKAQMAYALKGTNEALQNAFFGCMTERASKLMKDEIRSLGMVKLKDVESAQLNIVNIAKELAANGEITLVDKKEDGDRYVE
ncbi:MAG: Flagellar motor switch protein FliG [Holosporales bacterium]